MTCRNCWCVVKLVAGKDELKMQFDQVSAWRLKWHDDEAVMSAAEFDNKRWAVQLQQQRRVRSSELFPSKDGDSRTSGRRCFQRCSRAYWTARRSTCSGCFISVVRDAGGRRASDAARRGAARRQFARRRGYAIAARIEPSAMLL